MNKNVIYFQTKHFSEVKSTEEGIKIEGFASTKDIDRYQDIIKPGAFNNAIEGFKKNAIMLLQHNHEKVIGKFTDFEITSKGLKVKGIVLNDIDNVKQNITDGLLKGFSIGYVAKNWAYKEKDGIEIREITELELLEISVVSVPANPYTLFQSVKGFFNEQKKLETKNGEIQVEVLGDEIKSENVEEHTSEEIKASEVDEDETKENEEIVENEEKVVEVTEQEEIVEEKEEIIKEVEEVEETVEEVEASEDNVITAETEDNTKSIENNKSDESENSDENSEEIETKEAEEVETEEVEEADGNNAEEETKEVETETEEKKESGEAEEQKALLIELVKELESKNAKINEMKGLLSKIGVKKGLSTVKSNEKAVKNNNNEYVQSFIKARENY